MSQVRASHILVPTLAEAVNLKEKITAGEDFAAVARSFSKCPSGQNGGDLGQFSPGMMVKPFEEAAYALKEGEISEIVQSDFGFHIIRLSF